MSTLEIPTGKRIASRISFYLSVASVLWIMGKLTPSETAEQTAIDRYLGVAEPVIILPSEEAAKRLTFLVQDR